MTPPETIFTNGIYADSGKFLTDPMSADELLELATNLEPQDVDEERDFAIGLDATRNSGAHFGISDTVLEAQVDLADLSICGWAVIFPRVLENTPEAARQARIKEALQPLLSLRQNQAGPLYRELSGTNGYGRSTVGKKDFVKFSAYAGGIMKVDPTVKVVPSEFPYYVLIVGSPAEIPFAFQYQLDVQYAVGRLDFGDNFEAYATYAANVVAAETGGLMLNREVALWAPQNTGDGATRLSRTQLVAPLYQWLKERPKLSGWAYRDFFDQQATHTNLESLLGGNATPALLFTAGHGAAYNDPERMRSHAGALVTQEWNGPGSGPLSDSMVFSADHLRSDANLRGMIVFNFACFGGGCPEFNEFVPGNSALRLAPYPMIAPLHQKMLGLSKGLLACVGHVDRAWDYQLPANGVRNRIEPFEALMELLMKGLPVGAATESFNARYSALGAKFSELVKNLDLFQDEAAKREYRANWIEYHDARNLVVNGDPAVRLSLGKPGESGKTRETLEVQLPASATVAPSAEPAPAAEAAPSTEPAPSSEATPQESSADKQSFGLPAGELSAGDRLSHLLKTLGDAATDLGPLEVRTYTSGGDLVINPKNPAADAVLQAITQVGLDGQTITCVPGGTTNESLLHLHQETVRSAMDHRIKMLTLLSDLARTLR